MVVFQGQKILSRCLRKRNETDPNFYDLTPPTCIPISFIATFKNSFHLRQLEPKLILNSLRSETSRNGVQDQMKLNQK